MSGLVSGLDTESLVKAGTANTKNAINSRKQKLQTLQWKQEAYRSVISSLSEFQSKYLDILSSDSIRSNSVMKANKAVSSDESLSVQASSSAVSAKYTITSVKAASAASIKGTRASTGGVAIDLLNASEGENKVKITLDGTQKEISFEGSSDFDTTKQNFIDAVNKAFDGVSAAKFAMKDDFTLVVENAADDKVSHIFTVGYADCVGLANDSSNMLSTSSTLGSIDFTQSLGGSSYKFSINGVNFEFDKDTTVKDMMNTINKSDAGVKMSFSSLTQAFTLETSDTGAGQSINVSQSEGTLLNALFNISEDQLGTAPTVASSLTDKTVDSSVEFQFTASKNGFESGDNIIINGNALAVTGLTKSQASETITVDDEEISAKLYTDGSGNTIYRYKLDGTTHYAKKNGDSFEDVMTVNGGTVNVNGSDVETTETEQLAALGIEKKYKEYSAEDIRNALTDAYKASFADGSGSFSVESFDDGVKITFTPGSDAETTAAATGNITLADTGFGGENGVYTNYSEVPYSGDYVVSDSKSLLFVANGTSEVTINGTGENGAVTINDLVNSGYFEYDSAKGVLSVTGKNILESISSYDDIKNLFGTTSLVGKDNVGEMTVRGSNAQMTINGVTLESTSNSFSIDGTTFNIENVKEFDETDIENGDAEEITVNVSRDTSKIKETVLNFVKAYNEMIDMIDNQLSTSRPKSDGSYYDPLTEEQEEEMDQDEIDKWNEKAKTGLLYRDSTLSKVFSKIRLTTSTVCGGMTLKDLGIDTSSDYTEHGKLVIDDESVLDSAIEKYGDEIATFFTDSENGFGTALNNSINAAIDTSTNSNGYPKGILTSVAGVENTRSAEKNTLYSQIESLQSIIDKLNDKYESQQERLWDKYTTLETYISNMNNQSISLFGTSLGSTTS